MSQRIQVRYRLETGVSRMEKKTMGRYGDGSLLVPVRLVGMFLLR